MRTLCIIGMLLVIFLIISSFKNKNEGTTTVSWYGLAHHGKKTASGSIFDMNALTAAHKKLPFGTKVKFTNLRNGKEVVVTITDRGPFVKNRQFDLSKAAFKEISSLNQGIIQVKYEIL